MRTDHIPGWALAIGSPFVEGVTSWPPNRFEFRIFSGHIMLQICLANLSERERTAFAAGRIYTGLYIRHEFLALLFKIEGVMDWSDQVVNINLVDAADRQPPEHAPDTHLVMSIVLVEATTGIVQGIRAVSFSKHATALLCRTLRLQLETPFDRAQHAQAVEALYRRYPTSRQLVQAATVTERAGSRV